MEGDGKGIVAIVQGLKDAGLAVTMIGRRLSSGRSKINGSGQVTHAKSSVETSTKGLMLAHTGAQICDDFYTSSYQVHIKSLLARELLAHCNVRPSSPLFQTPEFPRQRPELSRRLPVLAQGNFEIGYGENEESHRLYNNNASSRSAFTSPDRGFQSARGTETFVHSLRKYPSVSPDRNVSSDLVQRLIAYTQAKNFSKSSCHLKSIRNLRNRTIAETPKETKPKSLSKNVQTYTRTQQQLNDKTEILEKIKRDTSRSNTRKIKPTPPIRETKSIRYKDNQLNETFDYLRSTSPRRFSGATEVRYLNDVTRCLRDTIRQFCDDSPQVCPNIRRRYSRHRREHHGENVEPQSSSDSNNIEAQASVPMVSTGAPATSFCEAIPGTHFEYRPLRQKICCYCKEPIPCTCGSRSIKQSDEFSFGKAKGIRSSENSLSDVSTKNADYAKKLEDQVNAWLKEIPVYVNDTPENNDTRNNLLKDLVDKLNRLERDEYYEENVKNEILECVNNLPMWYPMSKRDQGVFKSQIIESLLSKVKNIVTNFDSYKEDIFKLMDGIRFQSRDSQGEIIDKYTQRDKLVDRLKSLLINPPSDKAMKAEVIKILKEFPIEIEGDKIKYVNNLGGELATKLKNIHMKGTERGMSSLDIVKRKITDWLDDVPEFTEDDPAKNNEKKEFVESLAEKLQAMQSQGIDNTILKNHMYDIINNWLESNIKNRLDTKAKHNLTKKLLQNLVEESNSTPVKMKSLKEDLLLEHILKWLENTPVLISTTSENYNTAKNLAIMLLDLHTQGKNDETIKSEITGWLDYYLESTKKQLDTRDQTILVNELIDIVNKIKADNSLMKVVVTYLQENLNLDMQKDENKKFADELQNKMKELKSFNAISESKESEILDSIADSLNIVSKNTGVDISGEQINKLAKKLALNIKASEHRKRWNKQDNVEKATFQKISRILDEVVSKIDENKQSDNQNEIQSKLLSVILKNIEKINSAENNIILKQMVDILKEKTSLSNRMAKKTAEEILKALQSLPLNNKLDISPNLNIKNSLKKKISHTLDSTNINSDSREEIESMLSSILTDQLMRGETDRKTKDRMITVLKDANVSDEESERIATELVGKSKDLSLSYKTQDSSPKFSNIKVRESRKPLKSAQNEILEYTEGTTSGVSNNSTKHYKNTTEESTKPQVDKISSDISSADETNYLETEGMKYFEKMDVHPYYKEQGRKALDSMQNMILKTSTPQKPLDKDLTFYPATNSKDATLSAIFNDDTSKQYQRRQTPSKEELQLMSQLVNKINHWMRSLDFNLNTKDEKAFKDTMIKDLASDIIDRQKYLQLNPGVKTSNEEELEHLKYQVFRWLNKLPDVKQLMPSISKANELMELIKAVPVPQLIKDKRYSYSKPSSEEVSSFRSLLLEISKWIESVPSNLYTSTDTNFHQQMIKKLAEAINRLQKNETLTEAALDDLIIGWLQELLNDNISSLQNMSEGLKAVLANKQLINLFNQVKDAQENNHNIKEDIRSMIVEWLKEKPFYKQRDPAEKRVRDEAVNELTEALTNALKNVEMIADDLKRDLLFLREIKSHLIKFPMDTYLKKDTEFLESTAAELLNYLKNLLQFQNITIQHSQRIADILLTEIDEWIKSLPLRSPLTASDKRKLQNSKHEIVEKIKDLRKKTMTSDEFDKKLKLEIKKWLQQIPLEPVRKQDLIFLEQKVKDLHNRLKVLENINQVVLPPFSNDDSTIKTMIENTSLILPFKQTKTGNDNQINNKGITRLQPKRQSFIDHHKINKIEVDNSTQNVPFQKGKGINGLKNNVRDPIQLQTLRQSISSGDIKSVVENWSQNLPYKQGKSVNDIKKDIEDFVNLLTYMFKNVQLNNKNNVRSDLEKNVFSFLKSLPLFNDKVTNNHALDLINKLLELIKQTPNQITSSKDSHETATTTGFRKTADIFYDNIMNWCDNLPIDEGKTLEEQAKIRILKQNFVSKLINKIADLNMNPDILSDDTIYEDLLKDEIEELLPILPQNLELQRNLPYIENDLLNKLRNSRLNKQNELVRHAYKQQLRDAISNTLPPLNNLSEDQQIPFEVLKDTLADAYINLHYSAYSNELKNKYKQEISDEINKFCNNYLKRFPATPLDSELLNRQLYTVLQNVPVPNDETIKTQVEQMRIKDEINDWLNNLPLRDDPAQELQKKKIVTLLAKVLHETEKEKGSYSNIEVNDRMKQDIIKWAKKLPLKLGVDTKIDKLADKLVNKLRSTTDRRRFSVSNIHHATDFTPGVSSHMQSSKESLTVPPKDNLTQYSGPKEILSPLTPPQSILSTEDREHLERIRQRVQKTPYTHMSLSKDASVSPIPIDASNQTDVGPPVTGSINRQFASGLSSDRPPFNQLPDHPISPNVIVKQYNWKNTNPPVTQKSINAGNQHLTLNSQDSRDSQEQSILKSSLNSHPPILTPQSPSLIPQLPCMCPQPSDQTTQSPDLSLQLPNWTSSPPQLFSQSPPATPPEPSSLTSQLQRSPLQRPSLTQQSPSLTTYRPCTAQPHYMPQRDSYETPRLPYTESSPPPIPQKRSFPSQTPPCSSHDVTYGPTSRPAGLKPQACYESPDLSSASSPVDEYDAITNKPYRVHPRITKLGSFNDTHPCRKSCGIQSRNKSSRGSPDEDSEWTIRFPDNTDFWGTPCSRRRPCKLSIPSLDGQLFKERKEEKMKCRCRERIVTKCMNRNYKSCNRPSNRTTESMQHCSKCCGVHCPHPSYLFFR